MSNFNNYLLEKLDSLWQQGLELWLDNGQLGFKAPPNLLEGENLAFIKAEKPNIITLLSNTPDLMQGFPVTHGQAGMFTAQLLDTSNPKFNLVACVLLKSPTNTSLLSQSLDACMQQHTLLHTNFSFSPLPSQPIRQIPNIQRRINIENIDCQQSLQHCVREWASEPFQLAHDSLLKAAIIQHNGNHYFAVSCHHLVCDFIGLQNVLSDIQTEYQRLLEERQPLPASHAAIDYKAHVLTEVALLETPESLQAIFNTVEGELSDINFSGFKPEKGEINHQLSEFSFTLPSPLTEQLMQRSKQLNMSLFNWTATAFSVLLARLSSDKQFIVNTPLANRYGAQIQGAGHFTNPLPLLVDFTQADLSFSSIAQQLNTQLQGLMKSQHYPAEILQQHYHYAANTAFSFNRINSDTFDGGLYAELILAEQLSYTHDLVLTGLQYNAELSFSFRYNTQRIKPEVIARFSEIFTQLLELSIDTTAATSFPTVSHFLSDKELQTIHYSNNNKEGYPSHNLAEQFFQQAEDTPNNIALTLPAELVAELSDSKSAQAKQFSYLELATLAKQYQAWLAKQNLQVNDVIAIFGERDQHYLAITMAALAAGLIVTPIDTQFPAERIKHMLVSSNSQLVFNTCSKRRLASLGECPEHVGQWINIYQQCLPDFPSLVLDNLSCVNTSADATNIIFFTSGSTGLPKAVPTTQAAISRLSHNNKCFHIGAAEACLFASNISFDATNIEIWSTLLHGGELVAVNKDLLLAPSKLNQIFIQHRIQHAFFTTALFNTLIAYKPNIFAAFTTVMFGGEASDNHAIELCLQNGKPTSLINLYGPTENACVSTALHLTLENFQVDHAASIGQAIGNSCAWVVDQFGNLQIPGGIGELLVGGDGVSPGYLAQENIQNIDALNHNKFIRDTFSQQPSTTHKLYQSGDLVYLDNNANIYFIGRSDDQIKIRGFRIQLAEIEQQLANMSGIQQVTVIADKSAKDTQLIAYYVYDHSSEILVNESDIKTFLAQRLPAYMLPHYYMPLATLPLTPNGKVDKRQLPTPKPSHAKTHLLSSADANLTATEALLVKCWQEVFNLPVSCIYDNFFELGGHSLLAVRLSSYITSQLLHEKHNSYELHAKDIFAYPSIQSLARHLDATSEAHHSAKALHIDTLPKSDNDIYPASISQQRLWFIQELNAGSCVYNMPLVMKLSEPLAALSIDTFNQALNTIAAQHELLNAAFIDDNGSAALQLNTKKPNLSITVFECENNQQLQQSIHDFSRQPFFLAQPPLIKVALLRCQHDSSQGSFLALNIHHIIADGWSAQLLLRDLFLQLQSSSQSVPLSALASTIHYSDFAAWQYSDAASAIFANELMYWQEKLAGAPSSLNLPIDKPRPATPSGNGSSAQLDFSQDEYAIIKAAAQQHKISLFSLLAACYQLLLARYCNQDDICIGFPVHGRENPQTHNMVGLFTNNLVLRQLFTPETTIQSLLTSCAQASIEALQHQNLTFDRLLEQLDIEKTQSFIPLLQASFSCEENTLREMVNKLSNQQASLFDSQWQVAKYDLHLSCFTASSLSAELEFNTDIFHASTVNNMLSHFKRLCLAVCQADENSYVLNLIFLSDHEIKQQVSATQGFNHSQFHYPELSNHQSPVYIHHFFEQQVNLYPKRMAVSDEHRALTYNELNQQANQLAHYLIQQGIEPGDTVACLLDRSVAMSVALLAILKTGANYTPLLNDMPIDRLSFIIEETQAKQLIFSSNLADNPLLHLPLIHLEDESLLAELKAQSAQSPNLQFSKDHQHLLNIIYTSGSTGKPKGVQVTQAGIINRLLWMQRYTPLTLEDKIIQKTPYNFDVSGWELFWPLMVGASIHYLAVEAHKDPEAISQSIIDNNITVAHFVPSMLQAFNQSNMIQQCTSLKRIFTSGEALQVQQANDLLDALPATELHNLYGPTEAAIDVSYFQCTARSSLTSIPIGKVIDNMRLYILDAHKQLLPLGATGDLYISGIGLAQGYLNRPEQNTAVFSKNTFKQNGDDDNYNRLYKTGDIARYLPDGNIEYLGRSDNQVKLRGLRIELGEIEHTLLELDAIEQATVMLQDIHGEPQLVAYTVNQSPITDMEIRAHLALSLPAYMLPFCFIPLDHFPLSANGKLDRKQLPKAQSLLQAQQAYCPPENETEAAIATMFATILSVKQVGIHDNFFLLGGHSLLATKLAAAIRSHFECPFELKEIFDHPTVHEISLAIIEQNMLQLGMDDLDDDDLLALLDDL